MSRRHPTFKMQFVRFILLAMWMFCLVAPIEAWSKSYWLPAVGDNVVGKIQGVPAAANDTLIDIGRRENLGFEEMRLANPTVDPWLPVDGELVVLPHLFVLPEAPYEGIVLNVAEMRIYHFVRRRGEKAWVTTHPVSIGRQDWRTPLGRTQIIAKALDPSWYPPRSVVAEAEKEGRELPSVVPPGPDNPLGRHAMRLGIPGYLIHGTNKPRGIGMRVSHGCIRMYPEDIEQLFDQIPVGTTVHIVDQPVKIGWLAGTLYLEVHPTSGEFDSGGRMHDAVIERWIADRLTPEELQWVDWPRVRQALTAMTGIPYAVASVQNRLP